MTHQKRKDYRCCHLGCQKIYCGYHSLKRHCAMRHGTYLLPPSSQPSALNNQSHPSLWEPPKLATVKDRASTSADYHSYFPPTKPHSVFPSEDFTSHGTSCNNCTSATNLDLSCNPKDPNMSQVKLPVSSPSWIQAADLSASHSMVTSNHWASASGLGGSVVDPVEPETVHTWEHNLDFFITNLQTQKEAPSIQPSKEVTGTRPGSEPSSAYPRRNQPILLKISMGQYEPQNKQQAPLISGETSCSKSNIVRSSTHQIEPIIPPLPPTPKSKTKKKRVQKILKASNIPTPPLPSPRPTTQRRSRPHPAYLVSPSQVAMASFSKERTLSDTLKVLQLHAHFFLDMDNVQMVYNKLQNYWHPSCKSEE